MSADQKKRSSRPGGATGLLEQLEFETRALNESPFSDFTSHFLLDRKLMVIDCGQSAARALGIADRKAPALFDCPRLSRAQLRRIAKAAEALFSSADDEERFLRIETKEGTRSQAYCLTLEKRERSGNKAEALCKLERIDASPPTKESGVQNELGFGMDLWSMRADERVFEVLAAAGSDGADETVKETVTLEQWASSILPEDAEAFREGFEQLLVGKHQNFHLRYRVSRPGGGFKWVSTIARRSAPEDGEAAPLVVGLHKDEAEIPHVLDDLKLFSQLARKVQLSIIVTDPAGRTLWCNEAFTATTGYELEDIIGSTPGSVLHGPLSDPQAILYMSDRIRRGKGYHAELVNYRKNGTPFYVRIDANPLVDEDGNVTRYISFQTDITESRKTQSAIARNEIKYRSLFDNSLDALLLVSPKDGVIIEANRSAKRYLDSERLVGQRLEDIFPSRSSFSVSHLNEMVEDPNTPRRESGEFVTAAGERRPVELSVNRTPIGDSVALFVTLRDVSEKRLLEEQLRHAQRMEAVGRLSGGIAHDFNNLLAGLRGFSELLCNSRDLSERDRVYAAEVLRITDRASKLTSRLLSFSRGKSDKPVVANLNDLVANLTPMLSRILKKDMQFSSRLDPDLCNVRVDPSQIEQVVMNLVVNGQEAISSHDGNLFISTQAVELSGNEIFITGKPTPGRYAQVSVKDNGHGISCDVLEKIFEPFFTTKKGAGTGLGLSIVYGIIQSNGGHLMVDSVVGEGTEFRLFFPEVLEPVEAVESTDHSATMPTAQIESGRTPTILVAEDQDQVREILELGLGQSGYTLLIAKDGQEAIKLARRHGGPIDLLLTDSIMPKASGSLVSRELREIYPAIKVVMMSGLPQQESEECKDLQVDAYVDKPFSIRKLLELIESLLGVPKG